jgi:hypothetical protein
MKLKKLSFPLVVALLFTATSCSSGSSTSKQEKADAKWPSSYLKTDQTITSRVKNAAPSNPLKDKKSNQNNNNGVLTPYTPKDNSASKTNTTVGVTVQQGRPPVVMPSDFCKLLGFECSSLNFTQFYLYGPTNFKAVAEIPNSSIKLPAGRGFAFTVLKTYLDVLVDGENSYFEVFAKTQIEVPGFLMPMDLRGRYTPAKNSIEVELMNSNLGLKNFLGVAGLDINSVSGKFTIVGASPEAIGVSLSGTLPTFLRDMGVNPGTAFKAAFEVGYNGFTLGMAVGSQEDGSANIFNLQNILSARYLAFSYSTTGSTIGGVDYPEGFALAFDGKFGGVSVVVNGVISFLPFEIEIDFSIGAYSIGGFEFEETLGTISRSDSKNSVTFSGGLKGYGVQGRLKGSFDALGGIELDAYGLYTPLGVNLGEYQLYMKSNAQGFEFKGTQASTVYGAMRGRSDVYIKSFPGKRFGFEVTVWGNLSIPGWPSYGTLESGMHIWNCKEMKCIAPDNSITAKINGGTKFYGDVRRDFEITVNPNNWHWPEEYQDFWYDKSMGYDSNGFRVEAKVRGWGSVWFHEYGVGFGNNYLSSSAGFSIPAITVPRVRICPLFTSCYWEGGQTISGGNTVSLGTGMGSDSRGFYVDVFGGSGAGGSRLYFS